MLLIVLLAFVAYGNTIKNDYNIDDAYIVPLDSQNDIIKEGVSAIPTLLTSRYNEGQGVTYGYRPMGKITMVFEYMFWGNNPHNSHIVNIILYAINIILLLIFLRMLAIIGINIPKDVIYIGLLLFLFHPIHTEVVASIKNREEILCFSFLIGALIFYLQFFQTDKWLFLIPSLVFIILSILSKETGVLVFAWMFLLTLVGYNYTDRQNKGAKNLLKYAGIFVVVFVLYNIVFSSFKADLPEGDIPLSFEQNPYKFYYHTIFSSIPTGIQTMFFYIKKLLIPFPLLFYYGYDMLSVQNWKMVMPYIGIVIIVLLVLYIARRFILNHSFNVPFWICVFGLSIFPFSNIVPSLYITGIVGERLVYQASLAFCMIMAFLIYNGVNYFKPNVFRVRKIILITGPILIAFLYLTIQRNELWKDKRTLYEHDIKYLSKSARANFMIANSYMKLYDQSAIKNRQYPIAAKQYLARAINVYPDYSDAKIKLALIHGQYFNGLDSAIYYLETVREDSSQYHLNSLELLGDLYTQEYSNEDRSFNYYLQYWEINQQNKRVYQKLVNFYFKNRMFHDIIKVAEIAIQNQWIEGYIDMGDALFNLGNNENAMIYYQVAIDRGYSNVDLIEKVKQYKNNKSHRGVK